MKTIEGADFITISATAGETYVIDYKVHTRVAVINTTDGIVRVSTNEAFKEDGEVKFYVSLTDGAFVNGLAIPHSKLYIKADGDGGIAIVRERSK